MGGLKAREQGVLGVATRKDEIRSKGSCSSAKHDDDLWGLDLARRSGWLYALERAFT